MKENETEQYKKLLKKDLGPILKDKMLNMGLFLIRKVINNIVT